MKIVLAGSRLHLVKYLQGWWKAEVESNLPCKVEDVTWFVHGGASYGTDYNARFYIERNNELRDKQLIFWADWKTYDRAAGPIRNKEMAEFGDFLLAFWDGKSTGTKNMIDNMKKLGKPYKVIMINNGHGPTLEKLL